MTVEERLEKLERELSVAKRRNRWLPTVVVLAVVGVSLVWTSTKVMPAAQAQVTDAGGFLHARGFVLDDKNGKPRAWLSLQKDELRLNLADENGKSRASLGVTKIGATLFLADENGKIRATLGASATVMPDGTTTTYPESNLLLFDPDGKVRWSAP